MPRLNRVDPWGDLHAVAARGMFTGNRGCLVDASHRVVRHHAGNLWITCLASFRGWKHPLDAPRRWTPLFFLDDAVALAAGHRPCAFCRPGDYQSYRRAVTSGLGRDTPVLADELNRRLAVERLARGRGLSRADDRVLWPARGDDLPDGTVIVADDGRARLVHQDCTFVFGFGGWTDPATRPTSTSVRVLTPPTSVTALLGGYVPTLHPSLG